MNKKNLENNVVKHIYISKQDSYRLKGVALIMMVSMHLMTQEWLKYPDMLWDIKICGNNLSYCVTQSVHASSAIFAFISGYVGGYKANDQCKMKRIVSIYVSYWVVSLVVNLPCIWINGTAGIENFEDFVLCILALSSKISTYCWYVAFFAFAVWTFPVIKVIIDNLKCNVHIKILLTILFFYAIRVIVKIIPHLGFHNFTIIHYLSMYGATMPIWVMGYLVSCYDLFDVITEKMKRVNRGHRIELIAAIFLSLLSIIRGCLICVLGIKSNLEALWIIFEIYFILILVQRICQVKYVDILLKWLGKQSLYIWLIHSVFMLTNIQKFTFILHIPIFVLIMVTSMAALISLPVGCIDRKLQRVLKIRNN